MLIRSDRTDSRAVGKVFIISLWHVRYCAVLAKGKLSNYSYRGEELAGFDFLDSLAGTTEVDVASC
jgi:hypothetical protein